MATPRETLEMLCATVRDLRLRYLREPRDLGSLRPSVEGQLAEAVDVLRDLLLEHGIPDAEQASDIVLAGNVLRLAVRRVGRWHLLDAVDLSGTPLAADSDRR